MVGIVVGLRELRAEPEFHWRLRRRTRPGVPSMRRLPGEASSLSNETRTIAVSADHSIGKSRSEIIRIFPSHSIGTNLSAASEAANSPGNALSRRPAASHSIANRRSPATSDSASIGSPLSRREDSSHSTGTALSETNRIPLSNSISAGGSLTRAGTNSIGAKLVSREWPSHSSGTRRSMIVCANELGRHPHILEGQLGPVAGEAPIDRGP